MQYWTKEKPNKTGYYWAKLNENETYVLYISKVSDDTIYVSLHDNVHLLNEKRFDKVLWGSGTIAEPQGLKI